MSHKVCPSCGGTLDVEREVRRPRESMVEIVYVCPSCGARSVREWRDARSTSGRSARPGALFWVAVALIAVWVILRVAPYGDVRSAVYGAVATAGEAYRHPGFLVLAVVLGIAALAVRRPATVSGRSSLGGSTADLHLRTEGGGGITAVLPDARGAVGVDVVLPTDDKAVAAVLHRLDELASRSASSEGGDDSTREVRAIGESLGRAISGETGEFAGRLSALKEDRLMLRLQPELARIPWELMVPAAGGQFLWQMFGVSRQLRASSGSVEPHREIGRPLRILLMANLEAGDAGRELPAAEREAAEVMEIGAKRPELLRVTRKSPRSLADLAAVLADDFDAVHYAGHASYSRTSGVGWELPDGETVSGNDLRSMVKRPPAFVFANACSAGALTGLGESGSSELAESFLAWGAPAYLGTLWELNDARAADFARVFYRELLTGRCMADCVNAARAALLSRGSIAWANYVLYGDPELSLVSEGRRKLRS